MAPNKKRVPYKQYVRVSGVFILRWNDARLFTSITWKILEGTSNTIASKAEKGNVSYTIIDLLILKCK